MDPHTGKTDFLVRMGATPPRPYPEATVSLSFSPDGAHLAVAGWNKTLAIWNVALRRKVRIVEGTEMLGCVTFHPNGESVAAAGVDGRVMQWEWRSSPTPVAWQAHKKEFDFGCAVTYSPDGKRLFSAGPDASVKAWDTAARRLLHTYRPSPIVVPSLALAVSRDGSTLAAGGLDNRITLLDVRSFRNVATLEGHAAPVGSLAFSPDGRTLAGCSWEGVVKLWSLAAGQEVGTFRWPGLWSKAIAFSPDGNMLVMASDNLPLQVWRAASMAEVNSSISD